MNESEILVLISIFIVVVFWIIAAILTIQYLPSIKKEGSGVKLTCPINHCATNIHSGEKRCPKGNDTIIADAGLEVCNPIYKCTDPQTPFAVNINGSISEDGICEESVSCRCINTPSCPSYISTIFETIDGNPYSALDGGRTSFIQKPSKDYNNIFTQFCTVPSEWLFRSTPGCGFTDKLDDTIMKQCFESSYSVTSQPTSTQPCLEGVLSYITNDSSSLAKNSYIRVPIACVYGKQCGIDEVSVWDTNYNRQFCLKLTS